MPRALICLVVLVVGSAACGGALGGDMTGGAGSGGTTGGGGATGRSSLGGEGGSPSAPTDYAWGDVKIHVGAVSADTRGFSLLVLDPSNQLTSTMLPAATGPYTYDGAYAAAVYGCASPGLVEVDVYSCASQGAPMQPGCVAINFRPEGVTGGLTLPNGDTCEISDGSAGLTLPPPGPTSSLDGGPPADPALGSFFKLSCTSSDGSRFLLTGSFVVPIASMVLLC